MSSKAIIISEVESTINKKYSDWEIGITNEPGKRKAQLGNPLSWLQWQAASEDVALFILAYFLDSGLKLSGKKPEQGKHVFILLKSD